MSGPSTVAELAARDLVGLPCTFRYPERGALQSKRCGRRLHEHPVRFVSWADGEHDFRWEPAETGDDWDEWRARDDRHELLLMLQEARA